MNLQPLLLNVEDQDTIDGLDTVVTPKTAQRIRSSAFMAIMNAYDKHVTRESLADMLDLTVRLFDMTARINFLTATKVIAENGTIDPLQLAKSLALITTEAEGARTKLIEHMRLVQKIPPKVITKH